MVNIDVIITVSDKGVFQPSCFPHSLPIKQGLPVKVLGCFLSLPIRDVGHIEIDHQCETEFLVLMDEG